MSKDRKYLGVPGAFLAGALILSAMTPVGVSSQEMDARWLPWLGCWEPAGELTDASLLCVRPAEGEDAVELLSVVDGVVESVDIVSATGQRRATALEGCEGWQSGGFSADAGRVYLHTDEACEGGQRRGSTSLMSWVTTREWLDVEIVEVGEQSVAWVRRYQIASSEDVEAAGLGDIISGRAMAVATARTAASAPATVDDVIEANDRVGAKTVQTWLMERNQAIRLDRDKLVRLADSGVPAEVIDVMIALNNPDRFALDRDGERAEYSMAEEDYSRAYGPRYAYGRSYYSYGLDPFYSSGFGIGYSPYGYGYGYGSSRFGFGGFGRFGGGGFGGFSPIINVQPISNRSSGGRVVNRRGYTRSNGGTSGTATRRSGGSSFGGGSSASSGSSGGAKVRSSAGSSARKAKPRGGGL